jgi:hypothetical protein
MGDRDPAAATRASCPRRSPRCRLRPVMSRIHDVTAAATLAIAGALFTTDGFAQQPAAPALIRDVTNLLAVPPSNDCEHERCAGCSVKLTKVSFKVSLNGKDSVREVPGMAGRPIVVPGESIVDVGGASDVMPIRITFASQDVDESRAEALHTGASAFCARALWPE